MRSVGTILFSNVAEHIYFHRGYCLLASHHADVGWPGRPDEAQSGPSVSNNIPILVCVYRGISP